ncbi:hypothetical protein WA026_008262 [Henosepilachna vigintioctopunctata]|uniref:Uncharacterized protein n=1 Tax=Henosepilachna vigintioctopunctata TaxID=420089 RepID=A0AAW1TPU7_9CUCU
MRSPPPRKCDKIAEISQAENDGVKTEVRTMHPLPPEYNGVPLYGVFIRKCPDYMAHTRIQTDRKTEYSGLTERSSDTLKTVKPKTNYVFHQIRDGRLRVIDIGTQFFSDYLCFNM